MADDEVRDTEPARRDTCPDCLGDGFSKQPDAAPLEECKTCGGMGWVPAGEETGRGNAE